MRLDHLLSKEFIFSFLQSLALTAGGCGCLVAVCAAAPFFNPVWTQNVCFMDSVPCCVGDKACEWCIGMLLGVWGNMFVPGAALCARSIVLFCVGGVVWCV